MKIFGKGKARIYKSSIIPWTRLSSRNSSSRHILRYISQSFKGWKPAFLGAFGLFFYSLNRVRQDVVKLKLSELIQSEENPEFFEYPQMAMNREDLYDKTFSIEDQIRYFKSNENELDRRIMLLLESDSFFFTTLSEVNMKARDIQKSGQPCSLTRARSRSLYIPAESIVMGRNWKRSEYFIYFLQKIFGKHFRWNKQLTLNNYVCVKNKEKYLNQKRHFSSVLGLVHIPSFF